MISKESDVENFLVGSESGKIYQAFLQNKFYLYKVI